MLDDAVALKTVFDWELQLRQVGECLEQLRRPSGFQEDGVRLRTALQLLQ